DPKQIQQAYEELRKLMPNVVVFNSDAPANPYIEGDIDIGMLWNGSSYMARQEGVHLQFIWPKEGAIFWMDSMAIPSNAKNVEGALKLIDYLLRPEVAAGIANEIGYPTPNIEARKLLPKSLTEDKSLYPDAETLKNGQWQGSVGESGLLYETLFQNLKAGG
ncbi:MAG: extracellular solute-binding protein, partial [Limnobaculum xujianqingii]